jgi:tRNA-dihydrouridine synthase 1
MEFAKAHTAPTVYLAPMVDGSELAFRSLCRKYGISTCYTPMLRAKQIIELLTISDLDSVLPQPQPRIIPGDRPLIVQLCGREPANLAAAAKALLTHYDGEFDGIDLNLGCPQEIACKEGIGAFLAEDQALTCECVAALAEAVAGSGIPISCKIRLVTPSKKEKEDNMNITTISATVAFAHRLVSAGCSLLACHCRERTAKHNGLPDLAAGAALVQALMPIPVIINGGIRTLEDVQRTLRLTKAHGVMIAQGLLQNHRLLQEKEMASVQVQLLAAEYLDYCEKFLPPSPYYIRKHLRHIFRGQLQGPSPNAEKKWKRQWQREQWRNKLWHLISRSHLTSIWQFRQMIHLYCIFSNLPTHEIPESIRVLAYPTFKSIRYRKGKRGNGKLRKDVEYHYQHLN